MSASSVAFIGALVYRYREFLPVLAEHLLDNENEVLPHLMMSDVMRWLVSHRLEEPSMTQSVFHWLETAYIEGDEDVRDVIVVSGVEMIPDPGQPGAEMRTLLGSHLAVFDPWRC